MGRISTYNEEIAEEICRRLADGEFLRVICREEGMSHWNTVHDWKQAHPDFAGRFARARAIGMDAIAEDSLTILEEKPQKVATAFGDKVDPGYVAWQKNRAEQRLKVLAKWDPKRYGEKLAIGGAEDLPPLKNLTDDDLEARIRAKLEAMNASKPE